MQHEAPNRAPSRVARLIWVPVGLLCVAIGAIGVVLPGLPSTIFFIGAAAAFAKSSPRLEAWLLGLPAIGPLVHNHRNGLGMPVRAKILAVSMIAVAVGASFIRVDSMWLNAVIAVAGVVGAIVVLRQPTFQPVGAVDDG